MSDTVDLTATLSEHARKERRALLAVSTALIAVVVGDVRPTRIQQIGVEFGAIEQSLLLLAAVGVTAYLTISFLTSAYAERHTWHVAFLTFEASTNTAIDTAVTTLNGLRRVGGGSAHTMAVFHDELATLLRRTEPHTSPTTNSLFRDALAYGRRLHLFSGPVQVRSARTTQILLLKECKVADRQDITDALVADAVVEFARLIRWYADEPIRRNRGVSVFDLRFIFYRLQCKSHWRRLRHSLDLTNQGYVTYLFWRARALTKVEDLCDRHTVPPLGGAKALYAGVEAAVSYEYNDYANHAWIDKWGRWRTVNARLHELELRLDDGVVGILYTFERILVRVRADFEHSLLRYRLKASVDYWIPVWVATVAIVAGIIASIR